MHKSYTIFLIIAFLVSCSSENTKQIEANLLIEPNYEFSAEFFECKLNDGYTLLNLESFLSTLVRSDLEQRNVKYDINVYFPKPNYVNQFIINVKNYSDQDIYNYILDRLSRRGFDEIAGCKFDKEEFYGQSLLANENEIINPDYVSEILRCEYNEGYNYGTFRIAIERFSLEIKSLDISYEALYLHNKDYPNSFIWINNIYKDNFSSEINSNWIKNPTAENVKKEFQENAKCIDSKIYDAFLIT